MENKKKGLNLRAIIPLATAIVSLVFIVVGLKDYGFWKAQPTPGFFPIIIAVVLLAASVACFFQIVKDKDSADVSYNRNELLVMLGAAAIILCTSLIGLAPAGRARSLESDHHHRDHHGRHHSGRIHHLAADPLPCWSAGFPAGSVRR